MKIAIFALIISITVGVVAQELNTGFPFEGMRAQSEYADEKKDSA